MIGEAVSPVEALSPFAQPFMSEVQLQDVNLHCRWTVYDARKLKVSVWTFENGKRSGKSTWFYPDGRRAREVNYRDGLIDGTSSTVDANGGGRSRSRARRSNTFGRSAQGCGGAKEIACDATSRAGASGL